MNDGAFPAGPFASYRPSAHGRSLGRRNRVAGLRQAGRTAEDPHGQAGTAGGVDLLAGQGVENRFAGVFFRPDRGQPRGAQLPGTDENIAGLLVLQERQ